MELDDEENLEIQKESENEETTEAGKFVRSFAANDEDDEEPAKKKKKGIIYVSNIPMHMNVTIMREMLSEHGEVGRIYLEPDKKFEKAKKPANPKKKRTRHFHEGWVEFLSKRVAKFVATTLNNKSISGRKKSRFYDDRWSLKYLPRFKWTHLSERIAYEKTAFRQRLKAEVSQARKEAEFFQHNLDRSEKIKKKMKKINKSDD